MKNRIEKINAHKSEAALCQSENYEFSNYDLTQIIEKIEVGDEADVYFYR